MGYHAVPLHLSEPEASIPGPSFRRLSCQNLSGASASRVDLVSHHVLQSLIKSGPKEYKHFEFLACKAIVHDFVAVALVAKGVQEIRDIVDILATEGGGITFRAIERSYFTQQAFNQMPNGHSGGDSMRVHYHVWHYTFTSERKIFLPVSHTTRTLLAMSTGEFISNLRDSDSSHLHFNEALPILIGSQDDLVNDARL